MCIPTFVNNVTDLYIRAYTSMFCKGTSFQSAFFNVDEFSLGPVFIEPRGRLLLGRNCANVRVMLVSNASQLALSNTKSHRWTLL